MGQELRSGFFPTISGLPPNSRHVNERWISSVWANWRHQRNERGRQL